MRGYPRRTRSYTLQFPAFGIGVQYEYFNLHRSLLQNSLGSGIYCREELLSLGARASRPHKTWQGRGDWLHRVGRFTRRLTLEQRLDKYAGGTPALPGGNPWLARCRSLSKVLFCRSILPPSHARLRILQKAQKKNELLRHQAAAGTMALKLQRFTVTSCAHRFSSKNLVNFFFKTTLTDSENRCVLPLVRNSG